MIGLISDIHGNYEALKAVLQKLDSMNVTDIVCMGDVVGYYSQVNECCDELRKRNIKSVMGNHDYYMANNERCPRSQSVNDCLEYQRKVITEENLEWVKSFPDAMKYKGLKIVHGGWQDHIDEYLEPSHEYFEALGNGYYVSGHNHVQRTIELPNGGYCNPGSVGQPRDGDNRAAFAVFSDGKFELYRVEYDYELVGRLMDAAGFNPYYYGCLRDASKRLHV